MLVVAKRQNKRTQFTQRETKRQKLEDKDPDTRCLEEDGKNKETKKERGQSVKRGRVLSKILEQQTLTLLILQIAVLFPFVLKQIIKRTHGNPL